MKKNKLLSVMLATTLSFGGNVCEAKESSSVKKYLRYGIPAILIAGAGAVGVASLGAIIFGVYKMRNNKNNSSQNNVSESKKETSPASKETVSEPTDDNQSSKPPKPPKSPVSTVESDSKSKEDIKLPKPDTEFTNWVKLLCGKPAQGFVYSSTKQFRDDNDGHLEGHHDYIQLMFPNDRPSSFQHSNLCIQKCYNEWDDVLKNNPNILPIIQNELRLNLIRILKFWKLDTKFTIKDGKVDISQIQFFDAKSSPLNISGDHNNLRATRVLYALRLFGLNKEHKLFLDELNREFPTHSSTKYWNDTKEMEFLPELIKKYKNK